MILANTCGQEAIDYQVKVMLDASFDFSKPRRMAPT